MRHIISICQRRSVFFLALVALVIGSLCAKPPLSASAGTGNLLPNASLEETGPSGKPVGWTDGSWGTSTRQLTAVSPGRGGTGTSVVATVSDFTNGSVQWLSPAAAITAGGSYSVRLWYKSNVESTLIMMLTRFSGAHVYLELAKAPASSTWAQSFGTFVAPLDVLKARVYQRINRTGSITTDDYSLTAVRSFDQGMVSITFDDGLQSQYDHARPRLAARGFSATYYLISGRLGRTGYLTAAEVLQLAANGNEIGSHTVTHPFLTRLSAAGADSELRQSQSMLQTLLGRPVTDFAYPNGDFNPAIETACRSYYASCRNSFTGWNTPAFRSGGLVSQYVMTTTTQATVQSWIDVAKASRSWLILMYHGVYPAPQDEYDITPTRFAAQMDYLKASGVPVRTVAQVIRGQAVEISN